MSVSPSLSLSSTQAPAQTTLSETDVDFIKQLRAARKAMERKPIAGQQAEYDHMMSTVEAEIEPLIAYLCFGTCPLPVSTSKAKSSRAANKRAREFEVSATL